MKLAEITCVAKMRPRISGGGTLVEHGLGGRVEQGIEEAHRAQKPIVSACKSDTRSNRTR